VAESLNARRERIAEKLMLRMAIGYRGDPYKLPEYAWALADKFLSSAPEQPQPQPPAEVERLRADLREAMGLLRAHGQPRDWITRGDAADWNCRYGKLLAKHKEVSRG